METMSSLAMRRSQTTRPTELSHTRTLMSLLRSLRNISSTQSSSVALPETAVSICSTLTTSRTAHSLLLQGPRPLACSTNLQPRVSHPTSTVPSLPLSRFFRSSPASLNQHSRTLAVVSHSPSKPGRWRRSLSTKHR